MARKVIATLKNAGITVLQKRNHGEMRYFMAPFLSGDGNFWLYLHKMEQRTLIKCVAITTKQLSLLATSGTLS